MTIKTLQVIKEYQAIQYTGTDKNLDDIKKFIENSYINDSIVNMIYNLNGMLILETENRDYEIHLNDWILKDFNGLSIESKFAVEKHYKIIE